MEKRELEKLESAEKKKMLERGDLEKRGHHKKEKVRAWSCESLPLSPPFFLSFSYCCFFLFLAFSPLIFSSSHLLIFSSSHLLIFSSSHLFSLARGKEKSEALWLAVPGQRPPRRGGPCERAGAGPESTELGTLSETFSLRNVFLPYVFDVLTPFFPMFRGTCDGLLGPTEARGAEAPQRILCFTVSHSKHLQLARGFEGLHGTSYNLRNTNQVISALEWFPPSLYLRSAPGASSCSRLSTGAATRSAPWIFSGAPVFHSFLRCVKSAYAHALLRFCAFSGSVNRPRAGTKSCWACCPSCAAQARGSPRLLFGASPTLCMSLPLSLSLPLSPSLSLSLPLSPSLSLSLPLSHSLSLSLPLSPALSLSLLCE